MSSIIKRKAKVLPAAYIQININELTIMIGPKDSIVKIYNEKSNDYGIREVITNKDISVLKQFFLEADGEKQELETEINKMIDKANEINFELLKEKKRIFSKKQIVENLQKDLDETSKYMDELNKQLEESKANIFIKIDPDIKEQYQKLSVSFEKLLSCMKIWNALTDKNVAYVENLVSRKLEAFNKRQQEHHEYYIKNFMKSTFQLSEHQSKEPNRKEIIEVETLIEYIEHKQFSIKVYPVTFKLNNNDFIKSKYHVFNLQNAHLSKTIK